MLRTEQRTLSFPRARSLGKIFLADDVAHGIWSPYEFAFHEDARGEVVVPANKVACLLVAPGEVDALSHLGDTPVDAVHASFTEFADRSLAGLSRIPRLRALFARNTKLSDAGLDALTIHASLQTLVLRKTPISDAGVAHLAALPALSSLDLSHTRLRTANALSSLGALQQLSLAETCVRGAGISALGRLPALDRLSLYRCRRVENSVFAELSVAPSLTDLDLGETNIGDAALPQVAALPKLTTLNLLDSGVTDAGIRELGASRPLHDLTLGRAAIFGTSFAALPKTLRRLTLFDTSIDHAALAALASLVKLEALEIQGANLDDGAIDSFVPAFGHLRELTLGATKVSRAGALRLQSALPACAVKVTHEDA